MRDMRDIDLRGFPYSVFHIVMMCIVSILAYMGSPRAAAVRVWRERLYLVSISTVLLIPKSLKKGLLRRLAPCGIAELRDFRHEWSWASGLSFIRSFLVSDIRHQILR